MDNAGYVALSRQSGLMRQMQIVANNIANASTTGFRKEGMMFSEFIVQTGDQQPSLSMATGDVRETVLAQGGLSRTGGTFDLAIEGPGFFQLETQNGKSLTRAGSFTPNENGELVSWDGARLLDAGGAPVFVPPDASSISIASDGTLSADGRALSQIGLYQPSDKAALSRLDGVRFQASGALEPVEGSSILQGFLEESNVNPVQEISRMIEVQRAYEMGQTLLDREDQRIRNVIQTIGTQ